MEESPPPPPPHPPQIVLVCCGRGFLSQAALDIHRATHSPQSTQEEETDNDGEYFGTEETPGMTDEVRTALRLNLAAFERLQDEEDKRSTLFNMNRPPRVNRNASLIQRLNDNSDDEEMSPPASPPQSNSQTSNGADPQGAGEQRHYACQYCVARYIRFDFLQTHTSIWHPEHINELQSHQEGSTADDDANKEDTADDDANKEDTETQHSNTSVRTVTTEAPSPPLDSSPRTSPRYNEKTKCPKCEWVAKSSDIRRHLLSSHSKDGAYQCSQCPCVFDTRRQLVSHNGIHVRKDKMAEALREQNVALGRSEDAEPQQFTCSKPGCVYKTQWANLMEHHVTTSHVDGGLRCQYCGCTFHSDLARQTHVASIHPREAEAKRNAIPIRWQVRKTGIAVNGIKQPRPLRRSSVFKGGQKMYRCLRCPYSSINSINFKLHTQVCARRHRRLQRSKIPGKSPLTPQAPDKEGRNVKRFTLSCAKCGSAQQGSSQLASHLERCHVEGGVPCPSCSCTFTTEKSMIAHNNTVHLRGNKRLLHSVRQPSPLLNRPLNPPRSCSRQCQKCPLIAKNTRQLTKHVKRSHVEGGLQCPKCPCAFATSAGVGIHMGHVHGYRNWKPQTRHKAETAPPLSQVTAEVTKKLKQTFRCQRCLYTTSSRFLFDYHVTKSHVEGGRACSFCPCTFSSEKGQLMHLAKMHKQDRGGTDDAQETPVTSQPPKVVLGRGALRCGRQGCSFLTLLPTSLEKHKAVCLAPSLQETGENSSSAEQRVQCRTCKTTFPSPRDLDTHVKKAHVAGGFACRWCSHSYSNYQSRTVHIALVHGHHNAYQQYQHKVKKVKAAKKKVAKYALRPSAVRDTRQKKPTEKTGFCDLCNVDFHKHCLLWRHQRSAHVVGGKACPYCPCSYKFNQGLACHLTKNHPGQALQVKEDKVVEKKLTCVLCEVSPPFKSFGDFSAHLLDAHGDHSRSQGSPKAPPMDLNASSSDPAEVLEHRRSSSRLLGKAKRSWKEKDMKDAEEKGKHGVRGVEKVKEPPVDQEEVDEHTCASAPSSITPAVTKNEEELELPDGRLKCPRCDYVSSHPNHIRTHLNLSHVKDGVACPFCPVTTGTKWGLDVHIRSAHKDQRLPPVTPVSPPPVAPVSPPPVAPISPVAPPPVVVLVFEKKPIQDQINKRGKKVPCGICEWVGDSVSAVKIHGETCHVKEARESCVREKKRKFMSITHECPEPECCFSFATKFALDVHMTLAKKESVHFRRLPPRVEEQEESAQANKVTDKLEKLQESWTDAVRRTGKSLHNKRLLEDTVSRNVPTMSSVKKEGMKPALRPMRCIHCNDFFPGIRALEAHKSSAHGNLSEPKEVNAPTVKIPKRYKCGHGGCPLIFRTQEELKCHSLRAHSSATKQSSPPTAEATEGQRSPKLMTKGASLTTHLPPIPRPVNRGRGRPLGSSWLMSWKKKIDNDNWRLADASSKASTLWTFDKKNDDDSSSSSGGESNSYASTKELTDVTEDLPTSPKKEEATVSMKNVDQPRPKYLKMKQTAEPSNSSEEMQALSDVWIVPGKKSSVSPGPPKPTLQSPTPSTPPSGRPVRKTAESAASFISMVMQDEHGADAGKSNVDEASGGETAEHPVDHQEPSKRPDVDPTSNETDDIVEIIVGEKADVYEPDSTSSHRRSDWLKEFMRFMCSRCSAPFGTSSLLAKHFQVCAGSCDSFVCVFCDTSRQNFSSLLRLKEHIWRCHRPSTYAESTTSVYSCALCKLEVKDRKAFIFHTSVPHLFRCRKCSFVCNTRGKMNEHKGSEHRDLTKNPSMHVANQRQSTSSTLPSSATFGAMLSNWRCTCGAKFARTIDFKGHVKKCKDVKGDAMEPTKAQDDEVLCVGEVAAAPKTNSVDITSPAAPEETDDKEECDSLVCARCGYIAASIQDSQEHANVVASNESVICDLCGYIATSTCDLTLHSRESESCGTSNTKEQSETSAQPSTPVGEIEVEMMEASKESSPSKEQFQLVQEIALDSDQLALSLGNLGEQTFYIFEVPQVVDETTENPT